MKAIVGLVPLLAALLLAGLGAAAAGSGGEEPDPSPALSRAPAIDLSGPFGRVPAGTPDAPAGAAPDGSPLDTWLRAAPLHLELDQADAVVELTVVARPFAEDAPEEVLSTGELAFAGPDTPGLSLILATLVSASHDITQHAWLVDVPAREGGIEALLDIPGPEVRLVTEAGSVAGEAGDGCYLYLCVTAGRPPAPGTLAGLAIAVGETPRLQLGDGSAMVAWRARLSSLSDVTLEPIEAAETFDGAPRARPELTGLAPPQPGEWLVEVRVEYDRGRGWGWLSYRLVAE